MGELLVAKLGGYGDLILKVVAVVVAVATDDSYYYRYER